MSEGGAELTGQGKNWPGGRFLSSAVSGTRTLNLIGRGANSAAAQGTNLPYTPPRPLPI